MLGRRGFIKRLFGVATATVVSEKLIPDDGVALYSAKHPGSLGGEAGFGLAPTKPEGGVFMPDPTFETVPGSTVDLGAVKGGSGVMTRADFAAQLKESADKALADHYALDPGSLEELWIDDGQDDA